MANESVPGTIQPITLLAPVWPIERVASSRRIPSWPEHVLLTSRPYTRLQPHRLQEAIYSVTCKGSPYTKSYARYSQI